MSPFLQVKVFVVNSAAVSFCWNLQPTLSIAIMQLPTSVAIIQVLRFYCNYIGGTFCCTYVCGLLVAVMKVTVSVAFMQWEVSATLFEIMQVGVSVAIMEALFSIVRYSYDYFSCNYASGCFCCSHVCDSFK